MDLIYTNEACTGCNKCVRACPVLTANVATEAGKVMVDSEKCIVWRRYYNVGIFEIYSGIDSAAGTGTQSDDVYGNLYEEVYAGQ